jgi:hypothetical protein
MERQVDDIAKYVTLTESRILEEEFGDIVIQEPTDVLMEDIGDLVFKLRSYYESEGSSEYVRGVEEGLALAANMLERLLERYSGNTSK